MSATNSLHSIVQKNGMKVVIFVFVLLIIIQHVYTNYHKYTLKNTPTKVSKEVEFNTKNKDRLQAIFSTRIDNAIKLLHQEGMTAEKWSELQRNDKVFDVKVCPKFMDLEWVFEPGRSKMEVLSSLGGPKWRSRDPY